MVLRSLLKNLTALVMCRNNLELLLDERKKSGGRESSQVARPSAVEVGLPINELISCKIVTGSA